ncbi:MAG: FkbM family methyltransferase [Anaerolinea sp.]|nr:FkbM family methyltransferase [Anaerolinea sp.]
MNIKSFLWKILRYRNTPLGVIAKSEIYKFMPKNPIIVEAGAHIGYDTLELAQHFPNGKIFAFEPVPVLFEELKKRINTLKNVQAIKLALSARSGKAKMFISSGASNGSSSLLPPKDHLKDHPDVLFEQEIMVECVTLDEWARISQVENIDLLWLDLQGYELSVLKASTNILKTVSVIYTEINLKEVYEGVPLYSELREWLEGQGFRLLKEAIPWEDSGNVLFIRNQK